jgi:hypothetical protein
VAWRGAHVVELEKRERGRRTMRKAGEERRMEIRVGDARRRRARAGPRDQGGRCAAADGSHQ